MEKIKLTDNNSEKKQPSNLEAEQALLGSILVNNDIIEQINNEDVKNYIDNKVTNWLESVLIDV